MKKLSLRIDVSKIDKVKIIDRTYDKDGATITEKNYSFDCVPVKEEKVIKDAPDYTLVKVGFLAEKSIKNADGTYTNGTIIGEALEFRDKPKDTPSNVDTGEATNIDDIPF